MSNFEGAMDNARQFTETLCQIIESLEAEIAELRAGQGRRPEIVTAEQVEAAAKVLWGRSPFIKALETTWEEWSRRNPAAAETWRENVRLTLTTAGLLIEGDE